MLHLAYEDKPVIRASLFQIPKSLLFIIFQKKL